MQRWSDGRPIAAVDLTTASPVRESFSRDVLGMSVLLVRQLWMRTIVKAAEHLLRPGSRREDGRQC